MSAPTINWDPLGLHGIRYIPYFVLDYALAVQKMEQLRIAVSKFRAIKKALDAIESKRKKSMQDRRQAASYRKQLDALREQMNQLLSALMESQVFQRIFREIWERSHATGWEYGFYVVFPAWHHGIWWPDTLDVYTNRLRNNLHIREPLDDKDFLFIHTHPWTRLRRKRPGYCKEHPHEQGPSEQDKKAAGDLGVVGFVVWGGDDDGIPPDAGVLLP